MEALWNLEDKWKLSTREAFLLLVCVTSAVVGLCIVTIFKIKARKKKLMNQETTLDTNETVNMEWSEKSCGWISMKRVLMGSMRWSRASKWEEKNFGWKKERGSPLLGLERRGLEVGWQSHNSLSPVWQRPILMGEKCELPRFSGLILYDERGCPLRHSENDITRKETSNQEKAAAVVRTTLKDLL
ncbi:putative Transmembrane protein [Quillaja saponaria]|uniref:Transmembrane protein n=1 Tax=Quillaja saponaria TaxID=32244 RepID=A0AAD7KZS5_QUISA|nr:putative Transmembrane protein [Quillaja saponaria]